MIGHFHRIAWSLYQAGWDGYSIWNTEVLKNTEPRVHAQDELPKEALDLIQRIGNLATALAEFSHYTAKACWYFTAFNVVCHVFTRLFTVVSLTYFASSVCFGFLTSDLLNIAKQSLVIERKYHLIHGPDSKLKEGESASLNERDVQQRAAITRVHLNDMIATIETLYDSLYILKYPLALPFERVSEHLEGIRSIL